MKVLRFLLTAVEVVAFFLSAIFVFFYCLFKKKDKPVYPENDYEQYL